MTNHEQIDPFVSLCCTHMFCLSYLMNYTAFTTSKTKDSKNVKRKYIHHLHYVSFVMHKQRNLIRSIMFVADLFINCIIKLISPKPNVTTIDVPQILLELFHIIRMLLVLTLHQIQLHYNNIVC